MSKLMIAAEREGYSTDQIRNTMTVGELIAYLEQFDEDEPRRSISETDCGSYIRTVVWFNVATSDIVLTKLECKPGFQFSK